MCPTQKMMEERSCSGGCVISPTRFRNGVLWFAAIVIVLGNLAWFLHALEVVLIGLGALTVGAVSGYVWVRRVIPARRAQAQQIGQDWAQQAAMAARSRQQFPAQQQALPPSQEVHQHLHLHGRESMHEWRNAQ